MTVWHHLFARYPELHLLEAELDASLRICLQVYRGGGKLLLCGNGGSASDCDHIVGELMKGFMKKRPLSAGECERFEAALPGEGRRLADRLQASLPAISLSAHAALCTAVANDMDAELVYAQQVLGYARDGDALIAISTSGNSANVVRAAQAAKAAGIPVIGMTGRSGGRLAALCDAAIAVPAYTTPDVQERHLPIYHALCIAIEEALFAS